MADTAASQKKLGGPEPASVEPSKESPKLDKEHFKLDKEHPKLDEIVLNSLKTIDLNFRAAANLCVDKSRQPIKRRVLGRLSGSPEVEELLLSLARSARILPGRSNVVELSDREKEATLTDRVREVFDGLSRDARFAVLVNESIEAEKRWSDLLENKTFREKVKGVFEKLRSSAHPVVRAGCFGTAALVPLTAVLYITPKITGKPLELPIALPPAVPVQIDFKSGGSAIPIQFVPTTMPVKLELEGLPKNFPVLENQEKLFLFLSRMNQVLMRGAEDGESQQFSTTLKREPDKELALHFPELIRAISDQSEKTQSLIDTRKEVKQQIESEDAVVQDLRLRKQVASSIDAQTKMSAALQGRKEQQLLIVKNKETESVNIQIYDRAEGLRDCTIMITAVVSTTVQLEVDPGSCSETARTQTLQALYLGQSVNLNALPNVRIQVSDINRPLFKKNSVELQITS